MRYIINEDVDSYIREIYAWTFEHEAISAWLMAIPITLWVILGLFYILTRLPDWENDSWMMAIGKVSIFIFTPILYFITTGYIGYYYYN